jgi:PAS domain S-box-containing protein
MFHDLLDDAAGVFATWFNESATCLLVCGTDGEIFAVNQSFETWCGYTSHELSRMGMASLSARDNDFMAESEVVQDCIHGRRTQYVVRKDLVPKASKPQAGEFSAVRYPTDGPMKWFLCSWTPFRSDTSAALTLAMEHIHEATEMLKTHRQAIVELDKRLSARDQVSDGERLWLLSGKLIIKHPRTAWMVFLALMSLFVSANLLSILKNIAGLQTALHDRQSVPIGDGIAFHAEPQYGKPVRLVTPGGNTIEFGGHDGLRDGTSESGRGFSALGRSYSRVRCLGVDDCWLDWSGAGRSSGVGDVSSDAGPSWRAGDGKSDTIF